MVNLSIALIITIRQKFLRKQIKRNIHIKFFETFFSSLAAKMYIDSLDVNL